MISSMVGAPNALGRVLSGPRLKQHHIVSSLSYSQ